MARVTKPGGHVILSANNPQGLWTLLDPWKNPLVKALKLRLKQVLERTGLRRRKLGGPPHVTWSFHKRRYIDETLANAGLIKNKGVTTGFGPIYLRHREILSDAPGIALNHRLQRLSDSGIPVLRSCGSHYLVLSTKGESAVSHRQQQEQVNAYFQSQSSFWREIYSQGGVQAEIYRARQERALSWIDSLGLAPRSRVLEIGCGAGFMAVALAQRGFRVHAIDSAEAMIELARRHAEEAEVTDRLSASTGDVYALAFEDVSFDLVVAIGVIAWLARPELALQEMARVTKPGGHVILTSPNPAELHSLLDPWKNPLVKALKLRLKQVLERTGLRRRKPGGPPRASVIFHKRHFIDEALANTGLVKNKGVTIGFGPFSLRRQKIFPDALGVVLHRGLQCLADRGVPVLRSTGMSYLVLTRKALSQPVVQSTTVEEEESMNYSGTPCVCQEHLLLPGNGGYIDERR
jgi:ubiquinone/menaquinone biosynthesis C-methylase UbiE